jgi:O-antigen biosynthesis protein
MSLRTPSTNRISADGKFFRLAGKKFFPKGVTYGPFAPDAEGCTFPPREQVARDFRLIRELNANLIRVYYVPPRWLLDLATEHELKVLVDVPWEKHRCFLQDYEMREAARRTIREAAWVCARHSAVFALSIANEIPAEIVRWHGAEEVADFIDVLVRDVKAIDPRMLCTFASFPPTEYLQPKTTDFITFNVYLQEQEAFGGYLARLQTLSNDKPLLLGEFGCDSLRGGKAQQADLLRWQIESAFIEGVAGTIVFSFTDDWFRGGQQITDWGFGLTTPERKPKQAFAAVQECYRVAPYFPPPRTPKVSVVVASYNGAATLRACLDSLQRLNYPDYEVILIDDGSKDHTQQIVGDFPWVINIRQENRGLSAARNAGIAAATGEIVAYTDSDCRADEDWLFYLVRDLLRSEFVGIGGHNFLPPEDSPVAAAVLVSPGGPSHVLMTDREAEHVPGCNMAFYKWMLDGLNGFDPIFRKAGDDVDVCWRIQEGGGKLGFSHAGFVWHYRRSTVKAYLKQQSGYGEAEAALAQKHPEYFNDLGGGVWRGRIYSAGRAGCVVQRAVIYHGMLGSGFFQRIYGREPSLALMLCTSLPFHLFVTLPLLALSGWIPALLPIGIASVLISIGTCIAAAAQAEVPPGKERFWTRPLVALLFFLQPIVRGGARYEERFNPKLGKRSQRARVIDAAGPREVIGYWSKEGVDRYEFLTRVQTHVAQAGWPHKWDSGWNDFDLDVTINRWSTTNLITATEELSQGRKFIRCNIRTGWSWLSVLLLVLVGIGAAVLAVMFAPREPYAWFSLAIIPFTMALLEESRRKPAYALIQALESAARELRLERYAGK